jgi:hypothetical protein
MSMGIKGEQYQENFGAFCPTLGCGRKASSRASEARPGIQGFQSILDSGFRRNDEIAAFCRRLIGRNPSFPQAGGWWWREIHRERFARR